MDDNSILKELATRAADKLKDAPEWMQNYNLLMMCKKDRSGKIEQVARILAAYGIHPEKIIPCMMEIMKVFLKGGEI